MKYGNLDEFSTDSQLIHMGQECDMPNVPIYTSVTVHGRYGRDGNPTSDVLEEAVAVLEHGSHAVSTGCGIAAIALTLQELVDAGDLIVCHKNIYDWATRLIHEQLPRTGGNRFLSLDFTDLPALHKALEQHPKVVYFETISNPMLEVPDMAAIIRMAHEAGARVVVDNTFAPTLVRPLDLGADVVVHSMTKYISGHGDAMGGIAVTNDEELWNNLKLGRDTTGGILNAFPAYLIARGLKTLPLRMQRHCENAQKLAEFFASCPLVEKVVYPGLEQHPDHETAKRQFTGGCGAMIGVIFKEDPQPIIDRLNLARNWVSLGDTHTLLYVRNVDERRGTPPHYVRVSTGIEEIEDLICDLRNAMKLA